MPAAIRANISIADAQDTVTYTQVRLEADPVAQPQLATTAGWMPMVDAHGQERRDHRSQRAKAIALRRHADDGLDDTVDDYLAAVVHDARNDRDDDRLQAHIGKRTRTAFKRLPLAEQLAAVQAWLRESKDPMLPAHHDALARATATAQRVLELEAGLPLQQAEMNRKRERFAQQLTEARDVLHEALARVARENKLPRDWPDRFFLVEAKTKRSAPEPDSDDEV